MEYFHDNNLALFIYLVAPGFVSIKIWGLLNSSPKVRLSENMSEAVIYSAFNALPFAGLFETLYGVHPVLACIVVFAVFPVLWPVIFYLITRIKPIKTRLTPTAWDHYFNGSQDCFALVHLKRGGTVGGLYKGTSFASSYPEGKDLYLQESWVLDEDGAFKEKAEQTNGFWVSADEIEIIEFLKPEIKPRK
jgi:hypothetical protein